METDTKKQRQHFYRDYASGQWSMSADRADRIWKKAGLQVRVDGRDGASRWVELHGAPTMVMGYPAEANESTLPITTQPSLQKSLDLVPPKRAQECAGEHSSQ